MRKLTVSLIAIAIITGTIFAGDLYKKKLNIESESSEGFSRNFAERTKVTVQISSGDLGSGRIIAEVYDPNGKKIAGGDLGSGRIIAEAYNTNEEKVMSESIGFSFNTKNTKGNYKIVLINKTNKRQKVEVSVNTSKS